MNRNERNKKQTTGAKESRKFQQIIKLILHLKILGTWRVYGMWRNLELKKINKKALKNQKSKNFWKYT